MMYPLPLHEDHVAAGGLFGDVNRWRLPVRFSASEQEVMAARGAVGLMDLSAAGKLRVTGEDRVRFLHRMLTNDIEVLATGGGCYAALLNHKGHLISDLRVLALKDEILLLTPPRTLETVKNTLERYVVADRVTLLDSTSQYALLSVQGPHAADVLTSLAGQVSVEDTMHQHQELQLDDLQIRAIRSDHTGDGGYDILSTVQGARLVYTRITTVGREFGIRPLGFEAINILRVEAGIPWFGEDMDESNLVQEALLDNAVSYTKGCYVGQETVARLHSRGHVNRHLCGIAFDGDRSPSARDKLAADSQEVGWITSAVVSTSLRRPIALAYIRREVSQLGTPVSVSAGDVLLKGEITALPFYPRRSA